MLTGSGHDRRTPPSPAQPRPVQGAGEGTHQRRLAARKQIIRAVEDTIQRRTKDAEAEALHAEFYERLDDPELDDALAQLPVAEIIKAICRDLGIEHHPGTHPWRRRRTAARRKRGQRQSEPDRVDVRTSLPPDLIRVPGRDDDRSSRNSNRHAAAVLAVPVVQTGSVLAFALTVVLAAVLAAVVAAAFWPLK